ncbi:MAG: hypothetical protein V3U02_12455, partial [Calditrichia bacterium]
RRGPLWRNIPRSTVIRHLSPVGKLPKEIRDLIYFGFGKAHKNINSEIVEVGGRHSNKWFSYQVFNGGPGATFGVIDDDILHDNWNARIGKDY